MALTPYLLGLNQDATYWPPGANDGRGGVTFGSPILARCRWQDAHVLFRVSPEQELVSEAVIYIDRVVEQKGMLALGDFTGQADPRAAGGREIRGVNASPSIAADRQLNKVFL